MKRVVNINDVEKPFISPTNEAIYELIGGRTGVITGVNNHSVAHVIIQAGDHSPKHSHKVSEETYCVLSGTAQIQLDDDLFELRPGDHVLIRPDQVHQITTTSTSPLEFLVISAPPFDSGDYFLTDA